MLTRVRNACARSTRAVASWVVAPQTALGEGSGEVAVTFDDGPDPVYTPAVLDVLAAHGAQATFFLIGEQAQRHPDLVRRILGDGHSVGSHTRSHPDMWTLSLDQVRREYLDGRRMVEEAAGRSVPLVRPPKGYLDLRASAVLRAGRFRTVLWDTAGDDWVVGATKASILAALGGLTDGAVVLLHDALRLPLDPSLLDRSPTVAALGGLLDRIDAAGLRAVALTG